jgi:putative AlgH/UPF0301 family transcriptional regulator
LIIQTLAELYPELEIELKFLEKQMLFAGTSSWKAGQFDNGEIVDTKILAIEAFGYDLAHFDFSL